MIRSPNGLLDQHQTPSSVYNYKTLNEVIMRPTSVRTSYQTSVISNNESDKNNQILKKLLTEQPLHSLSNISLNEILIEGQWKFRGHDDDHLRFKLMGIENLVYICHDIMNKTREIIKLQQQIPLPSCESWPLVKLDIFKTLTDADRANLNRAHIFDLMTIVYEAASTNASISQLVRIWREVSQHKLSIYQTQPKISYETAFRHLIHTPDNQLLQIALQASLITGHSRMDLQQLGEKLGVKRCQFDMGSIKESTKTFQDLIKLLREQKGKREREQPSVDINKLPYKPKKKRGLNANVSGTKFGVGKFLLFCHFKCFFTLFEKQTLKKKPQEGCRSSRIFYIK
jgi:hypothetical protein